MKTEESLKGLSKNQKICILQDRLRAGGTERNSQWLARELEGEQIATHLLLFAHPEALPPPAVPDWSALRHGKRLCLPDGVAPGLVRRLSGIQPDTVICMGRNANCYGFWIKKCLPGIRLVTTYRTNRHLPWAYRQSIRRSELCLTNSHWAADRLGRILKDLPRDRVAAVHNPLIRNHLLSLSRTEDARAAARQQLGIPSGRTIGVNYSHFVPGKNQSALLRWLHQARKKQPGWMLLLAGEGPEKKSCQRLAKDLGLSDHVRFFGSIEAIEPLLLAGDLYLSASLREGLPNALVEAQAAGLPVITYDTAGSREALIENNSGYATPLNDLNAFAAAIEDLRAQPTKRSAFSACAREYARKQFHPARICQQYLGLLGDV